MKLRLLIALALLPSPALAHEGHDHARLEPKTDALKVESERRDECLKANLGHLTASYCPERGVVLSIGKTIRF